MNNKKIKLLYVVSTLRSSGPTNQLLGIIKNLNKNLFETKVLTLSPEVTNTMINKFISEGIEVDSLKLNRIHFGIYGKKRLKKYIDQYSPDIIHTQGVRADSTVAKVDIIFINIISNCQRMVSRYI